jgi:hypothetical protein
MSPRPTTVHRPQRPHRHGPRRRPARHAPARRAASSTSPQRPPRPAILADAGFDAIIIENMHDAPYVHGDRLGPEIVAAMTRVGTEVASAVSCPLGVQILSGGNRHALAVAQSIGGSFIRCENFVYAHVADEGLLPEAEAGPLLRYRKSARRRACVGLRGHQEEARVARDHERHLGRRRGPRRRLLRRRRADRHRRVDRAAADPADARAAKEASGSPC